jgi:hypothetical protein
LLHLRIEALAVRRILVHRPESRNDSGLYSAPEKPLSYLWDFLFAKILIFQRPN